MRLKLLGAYHDGYIELRYPRVFSYQLELATAVDGHMRYSVSFRASSSVPKRNINRQLLVTGIGGSN